MRLIYLDHNSTTPPRTEALRAMEEAQVELFGNPSSQHGAGRKARALLESCRERLAALLRVKATEIAFTSGGTEANRLAIEGALVGLPGGHAARTVVSAMEHPSVLEVHAHLEARGQLATATRVGAIQEGTVDWKAMADAAGEPGVRLVSLQHANSETGVLQPVRELADRIRARTAGSRSAAGVLLHVDCVQSFGKTVLHPLELGADLITISSHKIGGPKGAGALVARTGCGWAPPLPGGPQERKMRPGTENLPAISGFVTAAELAAGKADAAGADNGGGIRLGAHLRQLLANAIEGAFFNGAPELALPNTVNVSLDGVPAELLLIRLDQEGVAVSMGSACASGSREPSHVLRAMGLPEARVSSALRFSTGWSTRRDEVEAAAAIVARAVTELRQRSGGGDLSGSPARRQ